MEYFKYKQNNTVLFYHMKKILSLVLAKKLSLVLQISYRSKYKNKIMIITYKGYFVVRWRTDFTGAI